MRWHQYVRSFGLVLSIANGGFVVSTLFLSSPPLAIFVKVHDGTQRLGYPFVAWESGGFGGVMRVHASAILADVSLFLVLSAVIALAIPTCATLQFQFCGKRNRISLGSLMLVISLYAIALASCTRSHIARMVVRDLTTYGLPVMAWWSTRLPNGQVSLGTVLLLGSALLVAVASLALAPHEELFLTFLIRCYVVWSFNWGVLVAWNASRDCRSQFADVA